MKKRGSTLLIALTVLLFAFLMGSMLLFSARSRRFERNEYLEHLQLFYAADAGITAGFHRLKAHSYKKRFYFPNKSGKISGKLSDVNYDVILKDEDQGKQTGVIIKSVASLGSREITLTAKAIFKRHEKIIENNEYYLKRKIYELWELVYTK